MCVNSSGCLCHHLEIAIKQDMTKELKVFFDRYYIDDLYNFILDAYKLSDTLNSHQFATGMNKLVENYLLENSAESINVKNESVKKEFMNLYDEKIDDLGSARASLNEKLIPLIQDVQCLAYQNLSGIDSFNHCLEKANQASMIDTKDLKSPRKGCTLL